MCQSCGFVSWAGGGNCKQCGAPLPADEPRQSAYADQPYGYGAPHDYYNGAPSKKRKGHAVASLVIGIVGFFTVGILLIGSVVGTSLGIAALRKESGDPSTYGGRGIAIAGIVMNALALFMAFPIGIIAAIAIPNLLAARRAANEASAVNTMRVITVAQDTYRTMSGDDKYGEMNELTEAGLMPEIPGGRKNGYRFTLVNNGSDFSVSATPDRNAGRRTFFYSSSDGRIHMRLDGLPATADDPPLEYYEDSRQRLAPRPELRAPAYAPNY
jgi:hypothetical protein